MIEPSNDTEERFPAVNAAIELTCDTPTCEAQAIETQLEFVESPCGEVNASAECLLDAGANALVEENLVASSDETDQDFNEIGDDEVDTEPFDYDAPAEGELIAESEVEPTGEVEPAGAVETTNRRSKYKQRHAEFEDQVAFNDDSDADDSDSDPSPERIARPREASESAKFAPQRLAKILAAAGIDARRKCEEFVSTGRVTVDGEVITDLAFRADPYTQKIELDGERLKQHRKVYFVLNKPRGVVCTNFDPSGRPRVIDLFPQFKERLFTIGRLDEESEGLLLVTNDGELANRLAHPRYRVPKFYLCHVKGVPSAETLASLKRGMYFEEGRFAVEGVRMKKVVGESSYLDIVLNEGQNREIRRLMARVDHKVMRLKRVGFGPIRLGDLPCGAFRPLNTAELKLLTDLTEQRAYLDNSAGRGRKKKFGDRPSFGTQTRRASEAPEDRRPSTQAERSSEAPADRAPRGDRPQYDRPRSDRPRTGSRPTGQSDYAPKRYGSQADAGRNQNDAGHPPRREYARRNDEGSADITREYQQGEATSRPPRTGARPPYGRNDSDQSNTRGPRRYGQGSARPGDRGDRPGSNESSDRPRGNRRPSAQDRDNQQSSDRGPRPPRDNNRFGGNRGIQRQFQANDSGDDFVTDDFVVETGDTDFGGGRRRFVSEEAGEQSFTPRPPRSPRRDDQSRPPRREYGQGGPRRDDQSRPPRREYGQGGPRRDDQSRPPRREYGQGGPRRDDDQSRPPRREYGQGGPRRDDDQSRPPRREYGQGGPRRDDQSRPPRRQYGQSGPPRYGNNGPRGNRPARPMTADGKEILEGRVTGYRTQTKEGPARRQLKAVQGMQANRQKRQQRRKKTDD